MVSIRRPPRVAQKAISSKLIKARSHIYCDWVLFIFFLFFILIKLSYYIFFFNYLIIMQKYNLMVNHQLLFLRIFKTKIYFYFLNYYTTIYSSIIYSNYSKIPIFLDNNFLMLSFFYLSN